LMPALENRHRWTYHHLLYSIDKQLRSLSFTAHLGEVADFEALTFNLELNFF
jgi:hypothetical protein